MEVSIVWKKLEWHVCVVVLIHSPYDQDYDIRKFEDTQGVIIICKSKDRQIQSPKRKRANKKKQCSTQNTLHRYIKIEQQ